MNIQSLLEAHSEQMVRELGAIFREPLPSEVRCVEITILREGLPWVPFILSFSDRFRGPTKATKPPKLLENMKYFFDPAEYTDRESQVVDCFNREENGLEGESYEELQKKFQHEDLIIANWIAECWKEADVSKTIEHAYCFDEDGWFKPIDLITGQHIKHTNIFSNIFDG